MFLCVIIILLILESSKSDSKVQYETLFKNLISTFRSYSQLGPDFDGFLAN